MHEFLVCYPSGDLFAVSYIDKVAYKHRNGLAAADYEPQLQHFAAADNES